MARTNVKSQHSKYSPGNGWGEVVPFITGVRMMRQLFGLLMIVGLVVGVVGCGDDDASPTSVSQDEYSETIVGTWNWYGEPHWTFSSDGTVEFDGWDLIYFWAISGSMLAIVDSDGNLWGDYTIEIQSMSSTQLVYINTTDKVDGSGTVQERVTHTR
ncbi:MAG: hypothetical protein VX733_09700 [Candidatus Latescibacterota bacterium]|nr:hypothetical protein [Candidatus Latescibacterota bacterium]